MGFMSRKVLPACASICVFCPALRARSRQPVKRYKKLIIDIFQDSSPNDRKISKLCDYAAKNPSRLPEIARMLEHRGYKAIRNIQLGAIRILVAVYTKLFSACQVQMSFLAVSAIDIIRSLLDEHQEDEIRILGCSLLFEFAHNQIDGTYVYQLESLLSNLCVLAKENGPEQRQRQLRSSGLRGLSAMLRFMGEHLHMPSEYDDVVSAVLCNYELSYIDVDSSASAIEKPGFWAQSCVEKISEFCKEATTTRRYLEPIFFYFDAGKHWSSRQGLAFTVLQQILHFMESFGNNCFLLAVLVRHLDHKSVSQEPLIKAQIVSIAASLTQQSTSEVTVVKVSVLSDMLRHLRNVLMASMDASLQPLLGDYTDFQLAIQKFLSELMKNIGSPSPIFEAMALTLENLSSTSLFSQSTMYSLLILGSIMAAQPLIIPNQQSFPEALLQQLSLAMVHPDSDTRLCAHRIFETILSSVHISEDTSNISVLSDQLAMPGVGFGSGLLQDTTQLHCKSRRDLDLNHEFVSIWIHYLINSLLQADCFCTKFNSLLHLVENTNKTMGPIFDLIEHAVARHSLRWIFLSLKYTAGCDCGLLEVGDELFTFPDGHLHDYITMDAFTAHEDMAEGTPLLCPQTQRTSRWVPIVKNVWPNVKCLPSVSWATLSTESMDRTLWTHL